LRSPIADPNSSGLRHPPRATGSRGLRHAVLAALLLVPIVGLCASAGTPSKPRIQNPHGSFKGECGECHGAGGWKPARIGPKFNHAAYGFPLAGAHAAAQCTACHVSLDFSQSRKLCVSCHQDPHRGELGTDCARCHSARSFIDRGTMLRAHQATAFPLTGSHAGLDCETCHRGAAQGQMRFVGTQAACQGCHLDLYRAQRSPDHVAGGFPLECQTCHSTLAWRPARFNHDQTAFPLTGAHRAVACLACHGDGVYHGKSADCYSCHAADYNRANDPPHAGAGFSTQCATCHNTTSWSGATFDHDTPFFPIYSGRHRGTWTSCTDCHTSASNYSVFNCLICHAHSDQAQVNSHHTGVSGYTYSSNACYTCHPRGRP
jgi:hypothetical protein